MDDKISFWSMLSGTGKAAIIIGGCTLAIVLPYFIKYCCLPILQYCFGCPIWGPRSHGPEGNSTSTSIEIEIKKPSAPRHDEVSSNGYYKSNITYPREQLDLEMTKQL